MLRNNHIEDYVSFRTDKKLAPIVFRLAAVHKVTNPFLQARFEKCQERLKTAGRSGSLCPHMEF